MNDIVYTLREFRAKSKEAFDQAQTKPVFINRAGTVFSLSLADMQIPETPVAVFTATSVKPVEAVVKETLDQVERIKPDWEPCKHGFPPEFCRHAKFVKGRKVCK